MSIEHLKPYQWRAGQTGNKAGRPTRKYTTRPWTEKTARVAFRAAITPEQRLEVTKRVLELATGPQPPRWSLRAVAVAAGLDEEYIRRTGRLPKPRTYVWA